MTPEQEAVCNWLYAYGYYTFAKQARAIYESGGLWTPPGGKMPDDNIASLLKAVAVKPVVEPVAVSNPFEGLDRRSRKKIWKTVWLAFGDDMPCPHCGERQLKTQDHLTCCYACNWQARNEKAK